jgi:hypothetical protein
MRVLALGSCRVHDPLISAQQRGEIEYLNGGFRRRPPLYLHDVHEAIQFVRLARGEIAMPKEIRRFAYDGGLRLHRRMIAPLEQAEHVVVEICTDKHYEAAGWTLNVNEIHARLVANSGAAAEEWWNTVDRQQRPTEALVRRTEEALRRRWQTLWQVDDGERLVLRALTLRYLSASEIAEGLARLQALLARPVLVVPHVAARLPDGSFLAERLSHVEKIVEAARQVGLPVLDPRTFVERDGQARVLDQEGTDFHHYAAAYLPIVGRDLVEALRQAAEPKSLDDADGS